MSDKREMYTKPVICKVGNIRNKTFDDSGWTCSVGDNHHGGDDDSGHHHHH